MRQLAQTALSILALAVAMVRGAHPPVLAADPMPRELAEVGIDERLGQTLPLDIQLIDENGRPVALKDLIRKDRPAILMFVYYTCPTLCNVALNELTDSLKNFDWTPGSQFDLLNLSFDPRDTWQLAAEKKSNYMEEYGRPEAAAGWHWLVGSPESIRALTAATGFRYVWDERDQQYAHTTALIFLTPKGGISRYLYGINYSLKDIRLALLEASEGRIGTTLDRVILYCYHYDPDRRGYTLAAMRVMRLAALLTVAALGGLVGGLFLWERHRRLRLRPEGGDATQ